MCCILYGGAAVNEAGNMRLHQYVAHEKAKKRERESEWEKGKQERDEYGELKLSRTGEAAVATADNR